MECGEYHRFDALGEQLLFVHLGLTMRKLQSLRQ